MPVLPLLFECRDVSVMQHGLVSLRNVSWTVRRGEQWAVLGANGAGKSALVAALTGQAHVSQGEIVFARGVEDAVASVSFQLQRAFVAQDDCFFQARWYREEDGERPTQTARQMLGRAPGLAALVRLMKLAPLLDRNALHLSTGEMRRVLIARALLRKPKVLLLDEPFIGLDVSARETLSATLDTLMRRGVSVIVFTTNPNALPRRVNRLLFLRGGKVSGQCPRRCPTAPAQRRRAFGADKPVARTIPPLATTQGRARALAVELRGVGVQTPEKKILEGIDWVVRAGERWALSGPNGAGKTTLLSLILGDHPQAFAQDVRLFGKARGEWTLEELKRRVGWASPDLLLHFSGDTTVLELACSGYANTMGLYYQPTRREVAHAVQWLKYFALHSHAEKPFRFLSEGQQRLVLLVRALVKGPPLIVLDEPCQGLDLQNRARVLKALDAVCGKGRKTLLYVSHYAEERPGCIDHELKLRAGRRVE